MILWFEKHSKISLLIVVFIGIVIFYISSLTFEQVPRAFRINWETIAYHFWAYFFLSLFLNISLTRGKNIALLLPGIMGAIAYGLSDEIHQLFVHGRACTFSDWMLDTGGVLLGALVYLVWVNWKSGREKAGV